jgi:hypothetical protein
MAFFELKVSSETEKDIIFSLGEDKNTITDIQFFMNTLNDDTLNRSQSVRAEFVIKGSIDDKSKSEIQKLAAWAIATEKDKIYREVNIIVKDNNSDSGEVLRRYIFSEMFVIDYKEIFGPKKDNKDDEGSFELLIAQKEKGKVKEVLPN